MMSLLIAALVANAAPGDDHSGLDEAVRRYDAAQVGGDKAALEELLAADYALVNSGGEVEDKKHFIADLTDPDYHLLPYTVLRPIERRWVSGAVMGGLALLKGKSGGKPFVACLRFVDVWRRDGSRWRVAYSQAARAKDEDCSGSSR